LDASNVEEENSKIEEYILWSIFMWISICIICIYRKNPSRKNWMTMGCCFILRHHFLLAIIILHFWDPSTLVTGVYSMFCGFQLVKCHWAWMNRAYQSVFRWDFCILVS